MVIAQNASSRPRVSGERYRERGFPALSDGRFDDWTCSLWQPVGRTGPGSRLRRDNHLLFSLPVLGKKTGQKLGERFSENHA